MEPTLIWGVGINTTEVHHIWNREARGDDCLPQVSASETSEVFSKSWTSPFTNASRCSEIWHDLHSSGIAQSAGKFQFLFQYHYAKKFNKPGWDAILDLSVSRPSTPRLHFRGAQSVIRIPPGSSDVHVINVSFMSIPFGAILVHVYNDLLHPDLDVMSVGYKNQNVQCAYVLIIGAADKMSCTILGAAIWAKGGAMKSSRAHYIHRMILHAVHHLNMVQSLHWWKTDCLIAK